MLSIALLIAGCAALPESVDAFLDELARQRQDVVSLEARFIMENRTPDESLQSVGRLLFVRPRRIVFRILNPDTMDPVHEILIDHSRVFEHDHELEQVQIYDRGKDPDMEALFAAFESDPTELRQAYHLDLFDPGDESDRAAYGLMLTPIETDDAAPRLFERVRIFMRDGDYLPTRIHIFNDAESQVILNFDDFEVNGDVKPEDTQLAAPRDTKVIENEESVRKVTARVERMPEAITPAAPVEPAP